MSGVGEVGVLRGSSMGGGIGSEFKLYHKIEEINVKK